MRSKVYPKVTSFDGAGAFRSYLEGLGVAMPCDETVEGGPESPLAAPISVDGMAIGNRLAINPMEGWDGETDGRPSPNTVRRWERFGQSGAKLIWGGEAVAVVPEGRANPNQLVLSAATAGAIGALRRTLVARHVDVTGSEAGLLVGLQLTHSGRFCKPHSHSVFEPRIAYRHPILDRRFGQPDESRLMSDDDLDRLVEAFVRGAVLARDAGFAFVDIKHCHGYLAHELLSARTRAGRYGGSFENRTRFLREVAAGIRAEAPGLGIGVRLSAVDTVPFRPDPAQSRPGHLGPGIPEDLTGLLPYPYAFGANPEDPVEPDLADPLALLGLLRDLGIRFVNLTAGSPYYTPHLVRPAIYPPSDGYQPPEDPLLGVMRHLELSRDLKRSFPDVCFVTSGVSYLQEFLPNVAQAVVRQGWTDIVGIGRLVLSYPDFPGDVLAGRGVRRKLLCRTFSDCTTAPRNGIVSGCYPLDAHYKHAPEAKALAAVKAAAKAAH
jgi:2,4-dienoyl-CoA reductase-like NADH-dependent reductase (Old Yellow Enzyme family)